MSRANGTSEEYANVGVPCKSIIKPRDEREPITSNRRFRREVVIIQSMGTRRYTSMRNAAVTVHISLGSLTLEPKRCVGRFWIFFSAIKING